MKLKNYLNKQKSANDDDDHITVHACGLCCEWNGEVAENMKDEVMAEISKQFAKILHKYPCLKTIIITTKPVKGGGND